jgi:hypothetical protein
LGMKRPPVDFCSPSAAGGVTRIRLSVGVIFLLGSAPGG